jgi:small-conductance mechanosensitive channel
VIDWYRRVNALDQTPVNSQDLLYRESARSGARQVLKLAFDFARAEAALTEAQNKQSANSAGTATTAARLKLAAATADQRVTAIKAQLADLAQHGGKTPVDTARQSLLAAQLDLATTQRDALSQYAGFLATATGGSAESLSDKIDQLEETVPEIKSNPSTDAAKAESAASPESQEFHPESAGIITLASELFTLTQRMNELTRLHQEGLELQGSCDQMRQPLRARVVDELHRANSLGATTQITTLATGQVAGQVATHGAGQDVTDSARMDADRQNVEALTADFKLVSSAGIPLGEQSAILAETAAMLSNWHDALRRQYVSAGLSLLLRTLGTALVVIVLIIISELWRRATFRYVSEPRRRRQIMLVRRIVIGLIALMSILASVVTEFGSLATFAGLITAGVAVSLQTVILSGVAYFFFIGRFGVRVGDRVTVGGITGDVVEIGLFRIYLMELAGPITDLHSTGRMIVFSNAVLFQPSAFYKQLPGAEYAWHEMALTMSPDTDYQLAEKRLMAALESVFAQYHQTIEAQHAEANQILHIALEAPRPQVRMRFVDVGVEMVFRYPVVLQRASQIEDQITRKLLEAIGQEPKLKMVASGTPRIQSAA